MDRTEDFRFYTDSSYSEPPITEDEFSLLAVEVNNSINSVFKADFFNEPFENIEKSYASIKQALQTLASLIDPPIPKRSRKMQQMISSGRTIHREEMIKAMTHRVTRHRELFRCFGDQHTTSFGPSCKPINNHLSKVSNTDTRRHRKVNLQLPKFRSVIPPLPGLQQTLSRLQLTREPVPSSVYHDVEAGGSNVVDSRIIKLNVEEPIKELKRVEYSEISKLKEENTQFLDQIFEETKSTTVLETQKHLQDIGQLVDDFTESIIGQSELSTSLLDMSSSSLTFISDSIKELKEAVKSSQSRTLYILLIYSLLIFFVLSLDIFL